jgi:hypothetical protein
MRGSLATALAVFLAIPGAAAFAAPGRTWNHSGGSRPHHHHHQSAPVIIRTVPRYVYVAPYVPYYYSSPSYYSTPSYYPSSAYSAPAYSPPAYSPPPQPAYAEEPPQYAPPARPSAARQQGPYATDQGLQYRYLCLDTRKFYPDTKECPSGWLTVLPGGGAPPR